MGTWNRLRVILLLILIGGWSTALPTSPDPSGPLSASQRLILADGVVTNAELEGAYQGVVECLVTAGFVDVSYGPSGSGYGLSATSGDPIPGESDQKSDQRIDRQFDSCTAEYIDVVSDRFYRP